MWRRSAHISADRLTPALSAIGGYRCVYREAVRHVISLGSYRAKQPAVRKTDNMRLVEILIIRPFRESQLREKFPCVPAVPALNRADTVFRDQPVGVHLSSEIDQRTVSKQRGTMRSRHRHLYRVAPAPPRRQALKAMSRARISRQEPNALCS